MKNAPDIHIENNPEISEGGVNNESGRVPKEKDHAK